MSSKTFASSLGGGVQFATGLYTGDGAATQAIVGVGFQPKLVIIYRHELTGNVQTGFKTDRDGANAKVCRTAAWRYEADHIISLDVDGFTVGDGTGSANVFNINLDVYTHIAFR